jgi:long-chain acyl-CoA synthetase
VVRLLPELADFAARRYPASPFLLDLAGGAWKATRFDEFARAMHAEAARLVTLGVRPGDRIGLLSENRSAWGIAYMAILQAGAVVVPLDAQLRELELAEILTAAGARLCVVSARHLERMNEVRSLRLPQLRLVELDPTEALPTLAGAELASAPNPSHEVARGPDDLAVLIFTSGTTGQAKGVMLSHANLLHNVEAVAQTFAFGPSDRFLSVLPLHHTFESTAGFLCPLRVGASVAYARGLKSNELREDLRSSGATLLLGVPLLYEKMLAGLKRGIAEAPLLRRLAAQSLLAFTRVVRAISGRRIGGWTMRGVREAAGLGRVRMFVSGAAPLAVDLFWGYVDFGWSILEGYGLTECSPVVAANRPDRPVPGAIGWPVAGVEVRIDRPDAEGNGEIAVRGPNVMLGYFGQPQATADVIRDGWFMTGDLGRLDRSGRLRVTGRLKNMIATAAGKKIYPEEVEARLANSPLIVEAVVAAGRDARGEREEVHAHIFPDFALLEQQARASQAVFDDAFIEKALRREVDTYTQALSPYKHVKRIIVRRSEFPKTTTGKIRRHDLAVDAGHVRTGAVA